MPQMQLIDLTESLHQVALAGRLDAANVAELELAFTAALSGASKDAIVDLTAVEFCGSLAIRMFLSAARVLQRRDRRLVIAGARPQVQEVFETVALGTIVPIAATPQDARTMLGA